MKFGRLFELRVQVGAGAGQIPTPGPIKSITDATTIPVRTNLLSMAYPLTLQFEVSRNVMASANTGRFTIMNLAESTRLRIALARHDYLTFKNVQLLAGYDNGSRLPLIFNGNINAAYSARQKTDWMTTIEAFDGGADIINSQVGKTYPQNLDLRSVIVDVIKTMSNTTLGGVGAFSTPNASRGRTVSGNSWEQIQKLAGAKAQTFIDNGRAWVLQGNEYVKVGGPLFIINAESGLLGAPRWQDAKLALPGAQQFGARVDVTMIFEPLLQVGQLVQLESEDLTFSGQYTVSGITHRGTISGAVGGECVTVLNLLAASRTLTAVSS